MSLLEGLPTWKEGDATLFDVRALVSVSELNTLFLSTLAGIATAPGYATADDTVGKLALSVSRQTVTAREALAQCPIALVDMGFRDSERWAQAITQPDSQIASPGGIFPVLDSIRIAHQTLILAWSTAQKAWLGACLVFGMTRSCAEILSRASLQIFQRVAERYPHWVRPIWEQHPEMWDYLIATSASPPKKLPPVGFRALQRRLADFEPNATGEEDETRSPRDLE